MISGTEKNHCIQNFNKDADCTIARCKSVRFYRYTRRKLFLLSFKEKPRQGRHRSYSSLERHKFDREIEKRENHAGYSRFLSIRLTQVFVRTELERNFRFISALDCCIFGAQVKMPNLAWPIWTHIELFIYRI